MENNTFLSSDIGSLKLKDTIITSINVNNDTINEENLSKLPTGQAVSSYISEQINSIKKHVVDDYTAFEVFPTSAVISAGTKSDVVMVGYPYSNGDTYNVGDIVLMPSQEKVYTAILSSELVVPGETEEWENYWREGSINGDDYYLTYAADVPQCNEITLSFYSYKRHKEDVDVVIDWGDGSTTIVKDDPAISFIDYQDDINGQDTWKYSAFTAYHEYKVEDPNNSEEYVPAHGKFIVKIFGQDYFMVRDAAYSSVNSIISRVFDRDLPIASCLRNTSSMCRSKRLLKLSIPYEYDFKNLCNISNMFYGCINLKSFSLDDGTILNKFQAYSNAFNGCINLQANINDVLKFFSIPSEDTKYGATIRNCSKLYGVVDGSNFWLNAATSDIPDSNKNMFSGCSNEIRSQVPVAWGGTNIQIPSSPNAATQIKIDNVQANVDDVQYYASTIENELGVISGASLDRLDKDVSYNLHLSAFANYQNGAISQQTNPTNNYVYAELAPVNPDSTYYFTTTLRANAGVVAYDNDKIVSSWCCDQRIVLSNGELASNIQNASLSTGIPVNELSSYLSSATASDPMHYKIVEYPYATFIQQDTSISAYKIHIPRNTTKLYISNLEQASTPLSIACYSDGYSKFAQKVQSIEDGASYENFIPIEQSIISNYYIGGHGYVVSYSDTTCGITPKIKFGKDDVFRYTASIREINNHTYDVFDVFDRWLSSFNSSQNPNYSAYKYEDCIVECSAIVSAFPLAQYIRFGALEANKANKLSLKVEKLGRSYYGSNAVEYISSIANQKLVSQPYSIVSSSISTDYAFVDKCITVNGNVGTMTNWVVSELIPVVPGSAIEVSGYCRSSTRLYAYYDSTSSYIEGSVYPSRNVAGITSAFSIAPSNAAFIRVSGAANGSTFYPIALKIWPNVVDIAKLNAKRDIDSTLGYNVSQISAYATPYANASTFVDLSNYVIPGRYLISGEHSLTNVSYYATTMYMPVTSVDVAYYTGYVRRNTCNIFEVYDSSKNWLSSMPYMPSDGWLYDYEIRLSDWFQLYENGILTAKPAYCRFSICTNNVNNFKQFHVLKNNVPMGINPTIDAINAKIDELCSYSTLPGDMSTFLEPVDYLVPSCYILAVNGSVSILQNAQYSCTKFMPISNGDKFYYSGMSRFATTQPCGYAVYDKWFNFLSSYLKDFSSGDPAIAYSNYEVDATQLISEYEALNTGRHIAYIRFSSCSNSSVNLHTVHVARNNYPIYANYRIDSLSSSINSKIDDLSAKAGTKDVLYGKTYLTFGDSYTEATFTSWVDENGLSGKDSPYAWDPTNQQWKSYGWNIADRNAMTYINKGRSGGTLTYYVSSDNTPQTANSLAKDLTTESTFAQLSGPIASADYITIAYGLNDQKWYEDHYLSVLVGDKNDSTISNSMWGAWNVVLSTILELNPTVKLGIIFTDGGFNEDQRDRQLSVANYWGIPTLDLKGDPQVPMMIFSGNNYGRSGSTSNWAKQERMKKFCMSYPGTDEHPLDTHPNPIGHAYRSTIIEDFLRRL